MQHLVTLSAQCLPVAHSQLVDVLSLRCRYKKTIVCQEVAKAKNVCQVSCQLCAKCSARNRFLDSAISKHTLQQRMYCIVGLFAGLGL